jgi:hypothetical protein
MTRKYDVKQLKNTVVFLLYKESLYVQGKPMFILNPSSLRFNVNKSSVKNFLISKLKGIVSPDWKDLQMVSLDRFEV